MSCTRPLKAFPYGTTVNGKTNYVICSYDIKRLEIVKNGNNEIIKKTSSDVPSPEARKIITNYVEIPCGVCESCRLAHARSWADRIQMETKKYKNNCFVTLTYDEANIPKSHGINITYNLETGEQLKEILEERTGNESSLYFEDLQKFIKALRERLYRKRRAELKEKYKYKRGDTELLKVIDSEARKDLPRYFACGEYGSKGRPHYHLILFNYKPEDLMFHDTNELGDILYTSEYLSDIWKKGFVIIGDVTYQSASYVARYNVKKLKQADERYDFYNEFGIDKEFITMSLKPGIARDYYSESLFDEEHIFLPARKGVRQCKPPRYFKKILEETNPDKFEQIRTKNIKESKDSKFKIINASDKSYKQLLEDKELSLRKRTRILKERRI